jgi:hypothetical protein
MLNRLRHTLAGAAKKIIGVLDQFVVSLTATAFCGDAAAVSCGESIGPWPAQPASNKTHSGIVDRLRMTAPEVS